MKPIIPRTEHSNIIDAYRAGITLARIGGAYGVSRERIRQILCEHGVTRVDGGISVIRKGAIKKTLKVADRHGMTEEKYRMLVGNGATKAWAQQRRNAIYRGIEWNLGLNDWWDVWERSGKWERRGRGKALYVMARIGDSGAYRAGNVYIVTCQNNGREYQRLKATPKRTISTGIYLAYPGYSKPYLAKYGRKNLGLYESPVDALSAREQYISSNGINSVPGRGFWVCKSNRKKNPFQLYKTLDGKGIYQGCFPSRQDAESRGRELVAA